MGAVRQAVLEFDEGVQAPWRPRLVGVVDTDTVRAALRPRLSPGSASRAAGMRRSVAPPVPPGRSVQRGAPGGGPHVSGIAASPTRPASGHRALSSRPGARRVRLTRRARRLAVVLALAGGVALGSWVGPLLSGEGDLRLAGVNSVVVQSGDTLWSIASSLDGDTDVRAVVYRIRQLNALERADLTPGQVLLLP